MLAFQIALGICLAPVLPYLLFGLGAAAIVLFLAAIILIPVCLIFGPGPVLITIRIGWSRCWSGRT
jgi:hypothetical protein